MSVVGGGDSVGSRAGGEGRSAVELGGDGRDDSVVVEIEFDRPRGRALAGTIPAPATPPGSEPTEDETDDAPGVGRGLLTLTAYAE